jgi:hypothetical protein
VDTTTSASYAAVSLYATGKWEADRVRGGASYPMRTAAENLAFLTAYPAYADSLKGNARDTLVVTGGTLKAAQVAVTWMPPEDRVEKGEALVIASQAVHAELGERILRLNTGCVYKIERHETDNFRVRLPAEMRLLSVKGNNIREWTTEDGVLVVRLHSAVKDNYALALRFERILEKTPEALDVPFPVTLNTLREDGYVTLAHEPALRVRVESSSGLSQVDPRELGLRNSNYLLGPTYDPEEQYAAYREAFQQTLASSEFGRLRPSRHCCPGRCRCPLRRDCAPLSRSHGFQVHHQALK